MWVLFSSTSTSCAIIIKIIVGTEVSKIIHLVMLVCAHLLDCWDGWHVGQGQSNEHDEGNSCCCDAHDVDVRLYGSNVGDANYCGGRNISAMNKLPIAYVSSGCATKE